MFPMLQCFQEVLICLGTTSVANRVEYDTLVGHMRDFAKAYSTWAGQRSKVQYVHATGCHPESIIGTYEQAKVGDMAPPSSNQGNEAAHKDFKKQVARGTMKNGGKGGVTNVGGVHYTVASAIIAVIGKHAIGYHERLKVNLLEKRQLVHKLTVVELALLHTAAPEKQPEGNFWTSHHLVAAFGVQQRGPPAYPKQIHLVCTTNMPVPDEFFFKPGYSNSLSIHVDIATSAADLYMRQLEVKGKILKWTVDKVLPGGGCGVKRFRVLNEDADDMALALEYHRDQYDVKVRQQSTKARDDLAQLASDAYFDEGWMNLEHVEDLERLEE